jgi:hypothetical protein
MVVGDRKPQSLTSKRTSRAESLWALDEAGRDVRPSPHILNEVGPFVRCNLCTVLTMVFTFRCWPVTLKHDSGKKTLAGLYPQSGYNTFWLHSVLGLE